MTTSSHPLEANRLAQALMVQAAWPALIVASGFVAAPALMPALTGWQVAAASAGMVAGLLALALSTLLLFDALLFRVIASDGTDDHGAKIVDDVLARMRLKAMPATTRPIADRIAGTRKVLARQRFALGIFIASAVLIFASFP